MNRPRAGLAALIPLLLALFPATVPLAAQSLPELFQKAKAEVRAESWSDALSTLERLESDAARPGNESARSQLAAPIAFYRGVCTANLGREEEARSAFAAFLALEPNASLDASAYSKKAVAAFQAARKSSARARLLVRRKAPCDVRGLPGVQAPAQLGRAGRGGLGGRTDPVDHDGRRKEDLVLARLRRRAAGVRREVLGGAQSPARQPGQLLQEFVRAPRRVRGLPVLTGRRRARQHDGPRAGLRPPRPAHVRREEADPCRRRHGRALRRTARL